MHAHSLHGLRKLPSLTLRAQFRFPRCAQHYLTLAGACLLLALLSFCTSHEPGPQGETGGPGERPNFVIILADDLGYGDVGSYGGQIPTPQLDRMAAEGTRFTDFHSTGTVCTPTRAGLLTGRYQQRAGLEEVILVGFDQNRHWGLQEVETTLPELLRSSGYSTGIAGKWHLGYRRQYNPLLRGFDFFRGFVGGNIDYQAHIDRAGVYDWWKGQETTVEEGYATHLITNHALQFIQENRTRPFFLLVAHAAPHFPYQGPEDPAFRVTGEMVQSDLDFQTSPPTYGEMVEAMDQGVGRILETLQELNLADNTLVFFFSDNGANRNGSTGPLRGTKTHVWEGGHRVPAIAWWPGRIRVGVSNRLVSSLDLMPTMLQLAGLEAPEGRSLDGVDLRRYLRRGGEGGERSLFWRFRGRTAVRQGRWKLVQGEDDQTGPALFDLSQDLGEEINLAGQHPERVESMGQALAAWEKDVDTGATIQPEN